MILTNSSAQDLIEEISDTMKINVILRAIKHKNATEEVLAAAIDRISLLKAEDDPEHIKVLNEVINSNIVTSDLLIHVVVRTKSPDIMKNAIKSSQATGEVIYAAIKRLDDLKHIDEYSFHDVLYEIIKKNFITSYMLTKVIEKASLPWLIISAINSDVATEEVLVAVIKRINTLWHANKDEHIKVLDYVIKSKAVTPYVLGLAISKTSSLEIIEKAINSDVANEDVLDIAINRIIIITNGSGAVCMLALEKVINSNKVTPKLLVKVISYAITDSIIINAINSDVATDEVYDAALERAKFFDVPTQLKIEALVANKRGLKQSVPNPKIIKPPQVSTTSDVIKRTLSSQNNEDKIYKQVVQEFDEDLEEIKFTVESEDNVTERLRRNVEDGMSTMLWGLSGIGKTARVSEVDPNYTMIKLKNDMLPEEVTGGKEPNGEPGAVYPPYWYVKLCKKCEEEPDRMHILFIDEITNVKNNVKSLVWDIIEDRRVNGNEDWPLPENCAIVAAGNRPEESTAVITDYNGGVMPEPLHDRFDFHIEIPLDMNEWQQWAMETNPKTGNLNIHPVVLSFCVAHASTVMFTSLKADDVTQPRLSPRRWEKLSKAIYMAEKRGSKSCHVSSQRITECIGKDIAPAFIAHYEKQPINMKKVEAGLYKPEEFKNIDDKLFALSSLIAEYEGSEMAVIDFIETCLGDDYVAVYNVMKKQQKSTLENDSKELDEKNDTIKK